MNCDRVRVLIGVFDELDRPTQLALREHVSGCRSCTACWVEEQEFRQLIAARAEVPDSRDLTAPLLAIPSLDLRWLRARLALSRMARSRLAPLTLAAVVVVGGLWFADRNGLQLGDIATDRALAPGSDGRAGAGSSGQESAEPDADPIPVQRRQPPPASLSPNSVLAHPPEAVAQGGPAGAGGPGESGLDSAERAAELAAELAAEGQLVVVVVEPPERAAQLTPTPMARTSPPDAAAPPGGNTGRPGAPEPSSPPDRPPATELPMTAEPLATMTPTLELAPPSRQTFTPPTPTATPDTVWTLTVTVRSDDADALPTGELLLTADAVATDGAWLPIYETAAVFDAAGQIRIVVQQAARPPPYIVTVFGIDEIEGFSLCGDATAGATVSRDAFDTANQAELSFLLCPIADAAQSQRSSAPADVASPDIAGTAKQVRPADPPARPTSSPRIEPRG